MLINKFVLILVMFATPIFSLFSGEGTTYGGNIVGGTCGFQKSWNSHKQTLSANYLSAALNSPQWDDSKNCGRCASVYASTPHQIYKTTTPVIVQIVDKCPECKFGDLDFDPLAYAAVFNGAAPGRHDISWEFIDCPKPYIDTSVGVEIVLKEGSNEYWTAFQPQNFIGKISTMEIRVAPKLIYESCIRDETTLVGFYFLYKAGIVGPFQLRLTDAETGESIETALFPSLSSVLHTNKQFKTSNLRSRGKGEEIIATPQNDPAYNSPMQETHHEQNIQKSYQHRGTITPVIVETNSPKLLPKAAILTQPRLESIHLLCNN